MSNRGIKKASELDIITLYIQKLLAIELMNLFLAPCSGHGKKRIDHLLCNINNIHNGTKILKWQI
jgi:hypothetical protein